MKRKTFYYLGAAAAVLVVVALMIRGSGTVTDIVEVKTGDIACQVIDTGYVQPSGYYDLYATQSARVVKVPVQAGELVKEGQHLVILENTDLNVQISDLQSQLSQAAAASAGSRAAMARTELELNDAVDNLARIEELYQAGAVSRVEYDKARLQVESYKKTLEEQKSQLAGALSREAGTEKSLLELSEKKAQLVITSPADGTVLDLPAREEQYANPGTLLVTVAQKGRLEIKADILSDDLAEIRLGQRVAITAPVLGQRVLEGKLGKIYPRAEEKQSVLGVIQRRVPVIISLQDPANLKPGYEVKVAIETAVRRNVPMVPREAVKSMDDGRKEVLVVEQGRVRHRSVKTGLGNSEYIEIVAGLRTGEQIIADGSIAFKENARIKPVLKK